MACYDHAVIASERIPAAGIGLLLPLCVVLAGCVSQPLRPGAGNPPQVANSINLSGFPSEYKSGFNAGCASLNNTSGFRRIPPNKGASFVQGWRDGVDYCRRTYKPH
jgi:hypothetical protein